jgi:hypothetical protein
MSPNNLYIVVSSVYILVIGYDVYNWFSDRTIVAPEIKLQLLKSKINTTVLILGSTMLVVSVLFHINILRYSSPIPFAEIDSITLKDFKGYRKPYQTLDGQKKFAFITTSIAWKKTAKVVEVQAAFHPARSYVFNDKIVDRFLLTHELYHFRITEIFARRCRRELSQTKVVPSDDAISEIIADNEESESEMQLRYDEESYHGYLMKEQKRWEKNVDSLLNLLVEYKTPTVRYE